LTSSAHFLFPCRFSGFGHRIRRDLPAADAPHQNQGDCHKDGGEQHDGIVVVPAKLDNQAIDVTAVNASADAGRLFYFVYDQLS